MSGVVVVIGFLLLVPSILGILFSILLLFVGGGASATTAAQAKQKVADELVAKGVPKAVVEDVTNLKTPAAADLSKLTDDQRSAVSSAGLSLSGAMAGTAIGGATVMGGSICFGTASFIGGLLGWLLVMRKKVLQCDRCGAVVAAS
jgi:hypothetical protein